MKKLVYAIVIILVLLAGAVGYAVKNLDKIVAKNKDKIIALIEEKTGRNVEAGEIGASVWGGIAINLADVKISDDPEFSHEDFLSLASLKVNVALLPLLQKELQITKFILQEPTVRIIKKKDGRFNFYSMIPAEDDPDKEPEPDKKTSEPMDIEVSLVEIENGAIEYVDELEGLDVKIAKLDLSVENFGLNQLMKLSLRMAMFSSEQNIMLEVDLGPIRKEVDFNLTPVAGSLAINELDIARVEKSFPEIKSYIPKGLGLSGPLTIETGFSGAPALLNLKDLKITGALFNSPDKNFNLNANFSNISSEADQISFDGTVSLKPVELGSLLKFEYIANAAPKELSGNGPVSINASFSGSPSDMNLKADVDATGANVKYGPDFYKPAGTPLVIETDERIKGDAIDLKHARIKLKNLILTSTGSINIGQTTSLDLKVTSNKAELKGWDELASALKGYDLGGSMQVDAKITGPVGGDKPPNISGVLNLSDVSANVPDMQGRLSSLNSNVKFTGKSATLEDTSFFIGQSKFFVTGKVYSFSPLGLTYTLTSPQLKPADFMKPGDDSMKDASLNDIKMVGRLVMKDDGLMHTGALTSASGELSGIKYGDLKSKIDLKNSVANIRDFEFNALNGFVKLDAEYDMSEEIPKFKVRTNIQNINLTNLLTLFAPSLKDQIQGSSNLKLSLSGVGTAWEDISKTLKGSGAAEIIEGKLIDLNIADGVLKGLTGIQGLTALLSPNIKNNYSSIFSTKNSTFYNIKTALSIKDGKINIKNLLMKASDYVASADGWIGLDKSVDMDGVLTLSKTMSEDLAASLGVASYLQNSKGLIEVPFTLKGIFPGVKPVPNTSFVTKMIQRGLVRKGQETVQDELKKFLRPKEEEDQPETGETTERGQPSAESEPSPTPEQNLGDQLIDKGVKGLFKIFEGDEEEEDGGAE